MELLFEAMLYSNLSNEILMQAILDVHVGYRYPTPALESLFGHLAFLVETLQSKKFDFLPKVRFFGHNF